MRHKGLNTSRTYALMRDVEGQGLLSAIAELPAKYARRIKVTPNVSEHPHPQLEGVHLAQVFPKGQLPSNLKARGQYVQGPANASCSTMCTLLVGVPVALQA